MDNCMYWDKSMEEGIPRDAARMDSDDDREARPQKPRKILDWILYFNTDASSRLLASLTVRRKIWLKIR